MGIMRLFPFDKVLEDVFRLSFDEQIPLQFVSIAEKVG